MRKIAGRFRTTKGEEMYCHILSIIEILKRVKMNFMENIIKIFQKVLAIF